VFVPGKLSLMLVCKARSVPREEHMKLCFTWSVFRHKHYYYENLENRNQKSFMLLVPVGKIEPSFLGSDGFVS